MDTHTKHLIDKSCLNKRNGSEIDLYIKNSAMKIFRSAEMFDGSPLTYQVISMMKSAAMKFVASCNDPRNYNTKISSISNNCDKTNNISNTRIYHSRHEYIYEKDEEKCMGSSGRQTTSDDTSFNDTAPVGEGAASNNHFCALEEMTPKEKEKSCEFSLINSADQKSSQENSVKEMSMKNSLLQTLSSENSNINTEENLIRKSTNNANNLLPLQETIGVMSGNDKLLTETSTVNLLNESFSNIYDQTLTQNKSTNLFCNEVTTLEKSTSKCASIEKPTEELNVEQLLIEGSSNASVKLSQNSTSKNMPFFGSHEGAISNKVNISTGKNLCGVECKESHDKNRSFDTANVKTRDKMAFKIQFTNQDPNSPSVELYKKSGDETELPVRSTSESGDEVDSPRKCTSGLNYELESHVISFNQSDNEIKSPAETVNNFGNEIESQKLSDCSLDQSKLIEKSSPLGNETELSEKSNNQSHNEKELPTKFTNELNDGTGSDSVSTSESDDNSESASTSESDDSSDSALNSESDDAAESSAKSTNDLVVDTESTAISVKYSNDKTKSLSQSTELNDETTSEESSTSESDDESNKSSNSDSSSSSDSESLCDSEDEFVENDKSEDTAMEDNLCGNEKDEHHMEGRVNELLEVSVEVKDEEIFTDVSYVTEDEFEIKDDVSVSSGGVPTDEMEVQPDLNVGMRLEEGGEELKLLVEELRRRILYKNENTDNGREAEIFDASTKEWLEPYLYVRLKSDDDDAVKPIFCDCCNAQIKNTVWAHVIRNKFCQKYYDMVLLKQLHEYIFKFRKRRYEIQKTALDYALKNKNSVPCKGCGISFTGLNFHLVRHPYCQRFYEIKPKQRARVARARQEAETETCKGCGIEFIRLLQHLHRVKACRDVYGEIVFKEMIVEKRKIRLKHKSELKYARHHEKLKLKEREKYWNRRNEKLKKLADSGDVSKRVTRSTRKRPACKSN